jgi:hypothetical protein
MNRLRYHFPARNHARERRLERNFGSTLKDVGTRFAVVRYPGDPAEDAAATNP